MITFIILLFILLILAIIAALCLSVGGAVFIVLFGDLIVCIFLIIWIMKKLYKKR